MVGEYAIPADVRPLLGNQEQGITNEQLLLAIQGGTDEVNTKTNRQPPNPWTALDNNWDLVCKITRYHAAIEASIGIADYETSREAMRKELARMYETLMEYDSATTTDIVISSESATYAASLTGKIWSLRYPNLRKNPTTDNIQYSERDLGAVY